MKALEIIPHEIMSFTTKYGASELENVGMHFELRTKLGIQLSRHYNIRNSN